MDHANHRFAAKPRTTSRHRTTWGARCLLGLGAACCVAGAAHAADAPPPPLGVWTGKGQLGIVDSQGNTDAKSANAAVDLSLLEAAWKHALHLATLYGENAHVTAAERWETQWQSDYQVTPQLFSFGALRYEHDLFSGFEYQGSATLGAGYKLIDSSNVKLAVQAGAGYRTSRPEELIKNPAGAVIGRIFEPVQDDAIATAGLDYSQTLTKTTTLTDKLLVEAGSNDTLITNTLALTVKMSDRLALSLNYNVQDNTSPPAGLKKVDSIETINLVFGF